MKIRASYIPATFNKPARIKVQNIDSSTPKYYPISSPSTPVYTACKYAAIEYLGTSYKGGLSIAKDGEDYIFEPIS